MPVRIVALLAATALTFVPAAVRAQEQVPAIGGDGGGMQMAAIPPGMPPHISLPGPRATLDAKERHGVALAHRWKARREMPEAGPDGVVRWTFGSTLPTVVCAPLQTCDLALQPGEIVNNIRLGDKVRWTVTPDLSGAGASLTTHVNIKPHDAGLSTSLTIYTTRRTYAVRLVSTSHEWMPLVGFNYPDEMQDAWSHYRQAVAFGSGGGTGGGALNVSTSNAAGLTFYRIDGDNPDWKPLRAWTDGSKTVIEFPANISHMNAPALVALAPGSGWFSGPQEQTVNYRAMGDRYVVDQALSRAALISGVGGQQQRVIITREAR